MFRNLLVLVLLVLSVNFYAQEDAWIYFVDKPNTTEALANPISILTQKALDRKERHGIPVDVRDVPVNEAYISALKSQSGITVLAKSKWFNTVHVRAERIADIRNLSTLSFVDKIEYADKSLNSKTERSRFTELPLDLEKERVQFTYGTAQNQVEMISADALHESDYTGKDITIAVLDSGFPNVNTMQAFQRLREQGLLLGGYDFVNRSDAIYKENGSTHGTLVLSAMAAYIQDEFVGTAPDASYLLFNTEDPSSETPVEESYWVEAAERADSLGVDMINTSLGYNNYDNPRYSYATNDMNGQVAFISKGAAIAVEKGILVVVSAGNSGATDWQTVTAPGDSSSVLTVGAVDANGDYVSFSSQGGAAQVGYQKPDVMARGGAPFLVNENNEIVQHNGTSFSAPILCGGIASLWQAIPNVSATGVMDFVRQAGTQFYSPDNFLGYGIPNLDLARQLALSVNDIMMEDFKIFPNPVSTTLFLSDTSMINEIEFSIYNHLGQVVRNNTNLADSKSIDVSNLSNGVYMLKITTARISKVFKFIKYE